LSDLVRGKLRSAAFPVMMCWRPVVNESQAVDSGPARLAGPPESTAAGRSSSLRVIVKLVKPGHGPDW